MTISRSNSETEVTGSFIPSNQHETTPSQEKNCLVPEEDQGNGNAEIETEDGHGMFYVDLNSKCTVCQSVVLPEDAICCFSCNDVFHATCRDTKGVRDDAICVPSFLKVFSPVSKKYGVNRLRTGNFCYICDVCISNKVALKEHNCNSNVNTGDSMLYDSDETEEEGLINDFDSHLYVSPGSSTVDLMHSISSQMLTMKSDILTELSNAIDVKLESVISKFSCPSTNNISAQIASKSYSEVASTLSHLPSILLASSPMPDTNIHNSVEPIVSPVTITHNSDHESIVSPVTSASGRSSDESQQTVSLQSKKPTEAIVLTASNEEHKTLDNMNKVKKEVEKVLKDTQVEFVHTNTNSMNIVIGFKNVELRDKSIAAINSDGILVNSGYLSRCSNKMLPKISLFNIPEEVLDEVDRNGNDANIRASKKQIIVQKILDKNPCVASLKNMGHTLEVVYLNCNNETQLLTVGLKVSPAIKSVIDEEQQGNIYLGNGRYKYKDRFYIKHCFHCQMVGHVSNDCPDKNKSSVCMYCMGPHRSLNCNLKNDNSQYHCARCIASSYSNEAENGNNHHAGDKMCPSMLREIARLKSNTEFNSKNVM